jgi:uncharacterized membrane protein
MLNSSEYRIGAFAGLVALILVLALTAMAFNALDPERRDVTRADWVVSLSEPNTEIAPTF